MTNRNLPSSIEAQPEPAQLFALKDIGLAVAAEQGKVLSKRFTEVSFFLPKMVEVVTNLTEQGEPKEFSTNRYLGRVARMTEDCWRLHIAEVRWLTDVTEGQTTGKRTSYSFQWDDERVHYARKVISEHRMGDRLQPLRLEAADAGDCYVLRQSIESFGSESLEAFTSGAVPVYDQLMAA